MKKCMELTNEEKRNLVKEDYNAVADLYASEDKNLQFYLPFIDEFLRDLKCCRILDVGCGDGEFTSQLKRTDNEVVGLDFSKNLIKIAKNRHKNINFIEKDINFYEIDEKFDGIFSKDFLFHLPDEDIELVIKKIYDLLKDNGKLCLILDVPLKAGEEIYKEPLNENFSIYYNYLSPEMVEKFLKDNNFKIDKMEIINDENCYVYAKGFMVIFASKII